jgi:hypothetical protein
MADKRAYRTNGMLVRQVSGDPTNQQLRPKWTPVEDGHYLRACLKQATAMKTHNPAKT